MKLLTTALLSVVAASAAFGQITSFSLRSKYGAPVDRETFKVRPAIEMIVDYGPGRQICRIQLPSGIQLAGSAPAGTVTKQQIDEVLDEVLPPSVRGKATGQGVVTAVGAIHVQTTEYENLTIGETKSGPVGRGITVIFRDPTCPKATPQN